MKKILSLLILSFVICMSACSKQPTVDNSINKKNTKEEIVYADEDFINDAAKAFNERQDKIKKDGDMVENETDQVNYGKELSKSELSKIEKYANLAFKNTELKEKAISYINAVKKMIETYNTEALYENNTEYDTAHNARGMVLEYLSKNESYLNKIKEEHKTILEELKAKATEDNFSEVKIKELDKAIRKLEFKSKKSGYGTRIYTAILENKFGALFKNITFDLKLLDKENVIIETQPFYIDTFRAGEKFKVEFETEKKFKNIDVELDEYIEVSEN